MTDPLPWTLFTFHARSGPETIIGTYRAAVPTTLDDLEEAVLNRVAHLAAENDIPWNLFNVTLVIQPL